MWSLIDVVQYRSMCRTCNLLYSDIACSEYILTFCAILYWTLLFYTLRPVLYSAVPCSTVLHHTILYSAMPCHIVLFHIILSDIVLCSVSLHSTLLYSSHSYHTLLCCALLWCHNVAYSMYSAVLYYTILHYTLSYCTDWSPFTVYINSMIVIMNPFSVIKFFFTPSLSKFWFFLNKNTLISIRKHFSVILFLKNDVWWCIEMKCDVINELGVCVKQKYPCLPCVLQGERKVW